MTFYCMNSCHKIHKCWFSGLVALIHSILTVKILPSKNVLDIYVIAFMAPWITMFKSFRAAACVSYSL